MRCNQGLKNIFSIFLLILTIRLAHAQNISNMQIGVSSKALTILKFNSPVTNVELSNNNNFFYQKREEDTSLVIKTIGDTAVTTNLYVTEGGREHLFNLIFLPDIDINKIKLFYNFSDLDKLNILVKNLNQGIITDIIPNHQGFINSPNTGVPYEEVLAQRKRDSATAADAKSKAKTQLQTTPQTAADAKIAAAKKKQAADSKAALPKFYSHVELWRKYPSLIFELPPMDQLLAGDYAIPSDTFENARVSYAVLQEEPKLQVSSDTINNVNFVLQCVAFSEANCYMRILIKNKSAGDYLVGPINLRWHSDSENVYNAYPCFITSYPSRGLRTSFPALAPGVEQTIVLTTRAMNVKENDFLRLTLGDRLNKINLQVDIRGKVYIDMMDGTN